jgi:hypothetical protein
MLLHSTINHPDSPLPVHQPDATVSMKDDGLRD